jgi:hypothetical protein
MVERKFVILKYRERLGTILLILLVAYMLGIFH